MRLSDPSGRRSPVARSLTAKWSWTSVVRWSIVAALLPQVGSAQPGPQILVHAELPVRDARALAFSPDDRVLAVGDDDGRIFVFDLQTARQIRQLRHLRSRIVGLKFSADSRKLVAAGENRRLVEIDAASGALEQERRTRKRVRSLDLSPDGRLVVWAGDDGTVEVLGPGFRRRSVLESPNMFGKRVAFTAFGIQGSEVFAASADDARSAFWALGEGNPIRRDERQREEYTAFGKDHGGQLLALGVKTVRLGRSLASGGRIAPTAAHEVRLMDWNRGRIVREIDTLGDDVRAIAVSPDRSFVAIALENSEMSGYSTREPRRIMSIHEGDRVNAVEFSPSGSWLAAGINRGGVILWKLHGFDGTSFANANVVQRGDVLADSARYEFTTGSDPLIRQTDHFTMAVLELDNLGVEESLAASVMNLVVARLANVAFLELVERGAVQQVLDELKLQNTGITSARDAAEIGRLLNAENVLLGNVNQLGSSLTVALRLVETESGRVIGAREILCRLCRPEDLPQGVSLLVASLVQMN